MAFPATYDFNYYRGDTFEFRIYPKNNDGTVFNLSQFYIPSNFANDPDDVTDSYALYDSAQFTIANVRGNTGLAIDMPLRCFARVSDDNTHVQCAIRPEEGTKMIPGTEYVYDVEVRKPSGAAGSGQYDIIQTLLTGKITITDQVTGSTPTTLYSEPFASVGGVTVPVKGNTPIAGFTALNGYKGTVTWSGNLTTDGKFAASTAYVATITLDLYGYNKNSITANFFQVQGATSSLNPAKSGVITAVFPVTGV
jgi:hypothetical protein